MCKPRLTAVILGFTLLSVSGRVLTPNGDGRNDSITFTISNPADVAVSGRVFTLRGALVAQMRAGAVARSLSWDGRAAGATVPTGVYVYVLVGGNSFYRGTLVVIR